MRSAFLIFIFAIVFFNGNAQQFNNLLVKKEAGRLVVSYDISTGEHKQTFDIQLECSADGGETFNVIPKLVSGDIRAISEGNGKRIIWDIAGDRPELDGKQLVFQLAAVANLPEESIQASSGTFTDSRDGHIYAWIKIGTQTWMTENLAFLPSVSPPRDGAPTSPFYYVSGYDGVKPQEAKATYNYKTYGVLYNWMAATIASPVGWHLPTDAEWKQLEMELGMSATQASSSGTRGAESGTKMKTSNDWYNSGSGTNSSSFSGLPGGGRYDDGSFANVGTNCFWWSASEFERSFAWGRGLGYENPGIYKGVNYKEAGFSVRCVKD